MQPSPEKCTWLSHKGNFAQGSHRISGGLQGCNHRYPLLYNILCACFSHTPPRAHRAQEVSGVPGRAHTLLPYIPARSTSQLSHISSPGKELVPIFSQTASVRMVQTARRFCLKDKFKPLAKTKSDILKHLQGRQRVWFLATTKPRLPEHHAELLISALPSPP